MRRRIASLRSPNAEPEHERAHWTRLLTMSVDNSSLSIAAPPGHRNRRVESGTVQQTQATVLSGALSGTERRLHVEQGGYVREVNSSGLLPDLSSTKLIPLGLVNGDCPLNPSTTFCH
jgi:hypothetical protein